MNSLKFYRMLCSYYLSISYHIFLSTKIYITYISEYASIYNLKCSENFQKEEFFILYYLLIIIYIFYHHWVKIESRK